MSEERIAAAAQKAARCWLTSPCSFGQNEILAAEMGSDYTRLRSLGRTLVFQMQHLAAGKNQGCAEGRGAQLLGAGCTPEGDEILLHCRNCRNLENFPCC